MNFELLGHIIQTLGEVLIGFTAVAVHYRFWKEHKIDEAIFKEMKKEQTLGIIGIILIIIGFLLQIPGKIVP